jgi:protein-S-isoprenylcysteine O-methyltransferase Ste14
MSLPVYVLVAADFVLIAALPRLTFRRDGRLHLRWWLTATPLITAFATVTAVRLGWLDTVPGQVPAAVPEVGAVLAAVLSVTLMAATVGTHRIPLALWHQADDAPVEIVTWGPYRRVRHPFYVSFLLALVTALLAAPHVLTLAAFAAGLVGFTLTARREERRLLASALAGDYAAYLATTGRFVPRLVRRPA